MGKTKLLILPPAGVWLTLLFPAIKSLFESKDTSLLGKLTDGATSVMSDFAGDLFLNVADLSWGGFVFLLGLLGFTVSSIVRSLM